METLVQERARKPALFATVSRARAGLIGAAFMAAWHSAWCVAVAAGVAQKLVDFVFWLHFLSVPILVEPFDLGRALGLVAFTAAVGYAFGWTFVAVGDAMRSP